MDRRTPWAFLALLLFLACPAPVSAQHSGGGSAIFRESFDTARVPLLPLGWTTSKAKAPAGDFSTSSSTAYSAPASALATDARAAQFLLSPAFSLKGRTVQRLDFYERRSSTFNAGMLVEAMCGEDTLSWRALSDTLTLLSSSSYVLRSLALPHWLDDQPQVRLRWRTLGTGTGATGTLRLDDILVTVERACALALGPRVALAPASGLVSGADCACSFTLHSLGATAGTFAWRLALFDSTLGERVAEASGTDSFAPGDSVTITLSYPRVAPGTHRMHCHLECAQDEDTTDNDLSFTISAGFPPHAVAINEIMYEPRDQEAEYLELFNRSASAIDLCGWTIADALPSKKNRSVVRLSSAAHVITPGAFCVVADDSSAIELMRRTGVPADACDLIVVPSLGLNNTGDLVILSDATGTTIETVSYAPSWHLKSGSVNAGRSLERINPLLEAQDGRNWTSSVAHAGGTPGMQNSVFTLALPSEAALTLSPNPFSPDGDGREDFLSISYALQSTTTTLRVRIFDAMGRLVRTLANNEPSAARSTIIWDGCDDAHARVRMGIYFVFLEALDVRGAVLRTLKGAAVVAAQLE